MASAPPLANEAVGGAPAFFGGNSIARPWGRESSQALHRGGPPLWACASPPPTRVPLESLLRSEPATLNAAVAAVADSAFPAAASLGDAGVSSAIQKPHGGLLPQPPNPSSALASGEASCSSAPRGERASFFGVFKVAGAGLDASPVALSRNESSENAARSARFVAAQGRGRLYTPEGSAVPPPLPEARGSAANPLLRGDLQESDPLLRVQDVLQLQFQMAGRETAVSSAGGGGGIENGTQQNTNGFVGALLGYCSAEEMLDKQQVSTASDFERLDAVVPGDPEARIVGVFLSCEEKPKPRVHRNADAQAGADSVGKRPSPSLRWAVLCAGEPLLGFFVLPSQRRWEALQARDDPPRCLVPSRRARAADVLRRRRPDQRRKFFGRGRALSEALSLSARKALLLPRRLQLCTRPPSGLLARSDSAARVEAQGGDRVFGDFLPVPRALGRVAGGRGGLRPRFQPRPLADVSGQIDAGIRSRAELPATQRRRRAASARQPPL